LQLNEVVEVTDMFNAWPNVVLTGDGSAQRCSRPVELDVGHARELAVKA